jgi:hypothetical protein
MEKLDAKKLKEYNEFKASLADGVKSFLPLGVASSVLGILVTRTLFIGSLVGISAGWALRPYLTKSEQKKG